jgi:hypothetical protein
MRNQTGQEPDFPDEAVFLARLKDGAERRRNAIAGDMDAALHGALDDEIDGTAELERRKASGTVSVDKMSKSKWLPEEMRGPAETSASAADEDRGYEFEVHSEPGFCRLTFRWTTARPIKADRLVMDRGNEKGGPFLTLFVYGSGGIVVLRSQQISWGTFEDASSGFAEIVDIVEGAATRYSVPLKRLFW